MSNPALSKEAVVNKLSKDDGSRKYITLGEYRKKRKAKKLAKLLKKGKFSLGR